MPCAQHAVSTVVVQHRAVSGDDPRSACCQSHVWVHGRSGVEIDETGLQVPDKVVLFTEHGVFAELLHQHFEPLFGFVDGLEQAVVHVQETRNRCIVEAWRPAGSLTGTKRVEALEGIVLHGRDGHRTDHPGFNP